MYICRWCLLVFKLTHSKRHLCFFFFTSTSSYIALCNYLQLSVILCKVLLVDLLLRSSRLVQSDCISFLVDPVSFWSDRYCLIRNLPNSPVYSMWTFPHPENVQKNSALSNKEVSCMRVS